MELNQLLDKDLLDIIFYDFKKEVMIDDKIDQKLNRLIKSNKDNSIKTLVEKGFMFEDIKSCLKYKDKEIFTNTNNIKNWLSYRMLNLLDLASIPAYKPTKKVQYVKIDCDITPLVSEILEKLYGVNIAQFQSHKHDRRVYNKKDFYLESDTFHTFNTIFGCYFRTMCKELNTTWRDLYKNDLEININSDFYKFFWTQQNISHLASGEEKDLLKNSQYKNLHKDIINELNILARLSYTIGNFGLVPLGYNTHRGLNFNDFWEKSYNFIENNKVEVVTSEIFDNYPNKRKNKKEELYHIYKKDDIYNSIKGYKKMYKEINFDKLEKNYELYPSSDNIRYGFNPSKEAYECILSTIKFMNDSIIERTFKVIKRLNPKKIENISIEILKNKQRNYTSKKSDSLF